MPVDADFRLCSPTRFVADVVAGLVEHGVARERIDSASFGGPPAPGAMPRMVAVGGIAGRGSAAIAGVGTPAPGAAASLRPADGPAVSFSRSGVTSAWYSSFACLLDLAEASAVFAKLGLSHRRLPRLPRQHPVGQRPPRPEPLQPPTPGSALLCCAVPIGDLMLDA